MFVTNLLFFPTGGRQHKPLHPAPDGFIIMVLFCAAKGNGMARKNVKKYRRYAGILAAACLTVLPASGCRAGVQPLSRTGVALDTVVTITLYDCRDASLLDSCFAQIAHDEALFSPDKGGQRCVEPQPCRRRLDAGRAGNRNAAAHGKSACRADAGRF